MAMPHDPDGQHGLVGVCAAAGSVDRKRRAEIVSVAEYEQIIRVQVELATVLLEDQPGCVARALVAKAPLLRPGAKAPCLPRHACPSFAPCHVPHVIPARECYKLCNSDPRGVTPSWNTAHIIVLHRPCPRATPAPRPDPAHPRASWIGEGIDSARPRCRSHSVSSGWR